VKGILCRKERKGEDIPISEKERSASPGSFPNLNSWSRERKEGMTISRRKKGLVNRVRKEPDANPTCKSHRKSFSSERKRVKRDAHSTIRRKDLMPSMWRGEKNGEKERELFRGVKGKWMCHCPAMRFGHTRSKIRRKKKEENPLIERKKKRVAQDGRGKRTPSERPPVYRSTRRRRREGEGGYSPDPKEEEILERRRREGASFRRGEPRWGTTKFMPQNRKERRRQLSG